MWIEVTGMSSSVLHKYSKTKLILYTSYTITSIWGLIIFETLLTSPIDLSNESIGYVVGAMLGILILMIGPLGVVFAADRHIQDRNKNNAV